MNERAQIVRENENINIVEKFRSTSIIAAQKNGLCLHRVFLSTIMADMDGQFTVITTIVIISGAINFASLSFIKISFNKLY